MGWSSTLGVFGPAFLTLPSGWDQELLSPDLARTGRRGLDGILLALAMVPSALGMCFNIVLELEQKPSSCFCLQ